MTKPPFIATIEIDTAVDATTFDSAVGRARRLCDDHARVAGSTLTAIRQHQGDFSAEATLSVNLHKTTFENAIEEAYTYCRNELDEYDTTMVTIERTE